VPAKTTPSAILAFGSIYMPLDALSTWPPTAEIIGAGAAIEKTSRG